MQLGSTKVDNIPAIFKRDIYETNHAQFTLDEEENIASDVFTYRLLGKHTGVSATLSLPLFDKALSSREDVIVKTGSGHDITKSRAERGQDVSYLCSIIGSRLHR